MKNRKPVVTAEETARLREEIRKNPAKALRATGRKMYALPQRTRTSMPTYRP